MGELWSRARSPLVAVTGAGVLLGGIYAVSKEWASSQGEYDVQATLRGTVLSAANLAIKNGTIEPDGVQGSSRYIRARLALGDNRNLTVWMEEDASGSPQGQTAYEADLTEPGSRGRVKLIEIFEDPPPMIGGPDTKRHCEGAIILGQEVATHTNGEADGKRLSDAQKVADVINEADGQSPLSDSSPS